MDFDDAAGWLGATIILGVYGAGVLGFLAADTILYQSLNLLSCLGVGYIALKKGVLERATLNAIWAVTAIIAIVVILL